MIKSYRELHVWANAMDLTVEIYRQTKLFPTEEKFGLVSQMNRAVVSIPSNMAEIQPANTFNISVLPKVRFVNLKPRSKYPADWDTLQIPKPTHYWKNVP